MSNNDKENLSIKPSMELTARIKSLLWFKGLIRMTRTSQSPHKKRIIAALNRENH